MLCLRGDRHVPLWTFAYRALGEPDVIPLPDAVLTPGEQSIPLARTHVAPWHPPEVDTLQSRTCLLAGWLRHRGMHLESPSIRARR